MEAAAINRTVLLVEDSDDDAFFFERAFKAADLPAKLLRASDGRSAVDLLERFSAHGSDLSDWLLFLDLKLPTMSGFDVLEWIKNRGLVLEVIVLSGSDLDSDIRLARELGAADYLVKPIAAEQLRHIVRQIPKGHER